MLNIFADALLIAAGFGSFRSDDVSNSSTPEKVVRFPEKINFRAKNLPRVQG
jgi:hypothetical protein